SRRRAPQIERLEKVKADELGEARPPSEGKARNLARARGLFLDRRRRLESHLALVGADLRGVAGLDVAPQNLFRHRVLEIALDRPAHRTRPIGRIVALLDEELLGLLVELEGDFLVLDPGGNLDDLKID